MAAGLVVTEKNFEEKQKLLIRETAGKYGFETAFYSSAEEADEAGAFGEAEILYGGGLAPYLAKAPHLKWVCSSWAGVTPYCREGVMREDQLLTNASGAYGVTIAEYGVMTALMLMRGQISYNTIMTTHGWLPPMPQATLKDARVTCLGTGDIGRTFAKRVRGFEPKSIVGISRSGRPYEDIFDAVYPQSELKKVLADTDLLFMSLPATSETRDILNKETLACLPKGAYVVNVGRGNAIVEEDLIEALNEERIAGAALDVMRHEPLPEADPLWKAKNILITPHVAGNMTTDYTRNTNVAMFCEDLVNYGEGRPLKHLVDRKAGY